MEFDWNVKRNVQTISTNNIIQTQSLSAKEVLANGGNRVQAEQVIASLCVAVTELIRLQEEASNRINQMYERMGKSNAISSEATRIEEQPAK